MNIFNRLGGVLHMASSQSVQPFSGPGHLLVEPPEGVTTGNAPHDTKSQEKNTKTQGGQLPKSQSPAADEVTQSSPIITKNSENANK